MRALCVVILIALNGLGCSPSRRHKGLTDTQTSSDSSDAQSIADTTGGDVTAPDDGGSGPDSEPLVEPPLTRVVPRSGGPIAICQPMSLNSYKPTDLSQPWVLRRQSCRLMRVEQETAAETKTVATFHHPVLGVVERQLDAQGQTEVYTVDPDGRVVGLRLRQTPSDRTLSAVSQTIVNGRLVGEEQLGEDNTLIVRMQESWTALGLSKVVVDRPNSSATQHYRYDSAGRLAEVEQLSLFNGQTTSERTRWSYDAQGRPVQLDGVVDGELVLRHRWTWNESGRLATRQVLVSGAHRYVLSTNTMLGSSLSPLEPLTSSPFFHPQVPQRDLGCQRLPTSLGHGYPEAVYDLAANLPAPAKGMLAGAYRRYHTDETEIYDTTIGVLHHAVIGNSLLALEGLGKTEALRITIEYDAEQRMAAEQGTIEPLSGAFDRLAPTTSIRGYQRKRLFSTERLVSDSVTYLLDGAAVGERRWQFDYSADGRLLRRSLYHNNHLVDDHLWSTTADGQQQLEIRLQPPQERGFPKAISAPWSASQWTPTTPTLAATYRWRTSPTTTIEARLDPTESWIVSTFNAAGQLTESYTRVDEQVSNRQAWQYDTLGNVTERWNDEDDDGTPESLERWTYGTLGLLLEAYRRQTGANATESTTRQLYECQ